MSIYDITQFVYRGQIVKVTRWRNTAAEFQRILLEQKEGQGTKTIAITSTLVKKFRGNVELFINLYSFNTK